MILESIDRLHDAIAFVMTSKMVYTLGFTHVQGRLIERTFPSCGSRIVCLGDHAQDDDLPDGITSEDLAEVAIWKKSHPTFSGSPHGYKTYASESFLSSSSPQYETIPSNLVRKYWIKDLRRDNNLLSGPWLEALDELMNLSTPRGERVLCNLTKREYVDGPKAKGMVKYRIGSDIEDLLGVILRCKICWSSDPSISMSYNPGDSIHRGKWAADRFEVTSKDRLVSLIETGKKEWKDITKEAVGEVEDAWKAFWALYSDEDDEDGDGDD